MAIGVVYIILAFLSAIGSRGDQILSMQFLLVFKYQCDSWYHQNRTLSGVLVHMSKLTIFLAYIEDFLKYLSV